MFSIFVKHWFSCIIIIILIFFKFINFIQPMRVSSEEEELGLDATQHNEKYLQGHLIVTSNGTTTITETEIEKGTVYTS